PSRARSGWPRGRSSRQAPSSPPEGPPRSGPLSRRRGASLGWPTGHHPLACPDPCGTRPETRVAVLDKPETLAVDRQGLIPVAGRAADDLEAGRTAAEVVELPFPGDVVRDVAICGMGGSAIAGELVAGAYAERMSVQTTVVRDYA